MTNARTDTSRQSDPRERRARQLARAAFASASVIVAALTAAGPTPAAGTGGTPYERVAGASSGGVSPERPRPTDGGTSRRDRRKPTPPPVLVSFRLVSDSAIAEGGLLKLRYRVKSRAGKRTRTVRVKAVVYGDDGRRLRTIDLGRKRTGASRIVRLSREQLGATPDNAYKLRLSVTDGRGRKATRAARVPKWLRFSAYDHRFPIDGPFGWGGTESRFGAGRPGHVHQGQDLSAAEGTPVVAPRGGRVSWVKYQAAGAGWYVVLDANDGRDYVFMHLQPGSIVVKAEDRVGTGDLLARVGSTGVSSGPHLHFEIWADGDWQFGGRPIDPRPLLESWYASAPGGAKSAVASAPASAAAASLSLPPLD